MKKQILVSLACLPLVAAAFGGVPSHAVETRKTVEKGTTAASTPATSGPFVTLLFSRTEITGAIDCVPNSSGIARLDTEIAPYLQSHGMTGTGTLMTGRTSEVDRFCAHNDSTLLGSWNDAQDLAAAYDWSFVSHTATWPTNWPNLSSTRKYAETCGSAKAIDAHGLPGGHGLIAYGSDAKPVDVQTQYGAKCFAWARTYDPTGTTNSTAGSTSPYWQRTAAPPGGPCNIVTAACYNIQSQVSKRYRLPAQQIKVVNALTPGKWFTMQQFILVTGTNPPGSFFKWDCTSSDPRLHWTTDNERYCLNDWKKVVAAIAARPDITVTDPLTVGVAFGRPAQYPF